MGGISFAEHLPRNRYEHVRDTPKLGRGNIRFERPDNSMVWRPWIDYGPTINGFQAQRPQRMPGAQQVLTLGPHEMGNPTAPGNWFVMISAEFAEDTPAGMQTVGNIVAEVSIGAGGSVITYEVDAWDAAIPIFGDNVTVTLFTESLTGMEYWDPWFYPAIKAECYAVRTTGGHAKAWRSFPLWTYNSDPGVGVNGSWIVQKPNFAKALNYLPVTNVVAGLKPLVTLSGFGSANFEMNDTVIESLARMNQTWAVPGGTKILQPISTTVAKGGGAVNSPEWHGTLQFEIAV